MNVLFFHADTDRNWNSAEWRCKIPMKALNSIDGWRANMLPLPALPSGQANAQCEWADIIVIQRNVVGPVLQAMEYWKAMGKTIIIDLDDDYRNIPMSIPDSYAHWIMGQVRDPRTNKIITMPYPPIKTLEWGIKLAHAVTSPSKMILDDWKPYANDIAWIPNYIDFSRYEGLASNQDKVEFLGWGGSRSHLQSFRDSKILTALNRTFSRYKNMKFIVIGDPEIYNLVRIDATRKRFFGGVIPSAWPITMATAIHLGIAPLAGAYDMRRSWIKPMEYIAAGIPFVATGYPVYQETFGGRFSLVVNDAEAWTTALWEIIDHWHEYKVKAMNDIDYAREFDVLANAQVLANTYQEIHNRRAR